MLSHQLKSTTWNLGPVSHRDRDRDRDRERGTHEWNNGENSSHHHYNTAHNDSFNKSSTYSSWDGLEETSDSPVTSHMNTSNVMNDSTRHPVHFDNSNNINVSAVSKTDARHGNRDEKIDRQRDDIHDSTSGNGKNDFDIWGGDSNVWGPVPSPPSSSAHPSSSSSHPSSSQPPSSHPSSSQPPSSHSLSFAPSSSSSRPPLSATTTTTNATTTTSHARGLNFENTWGSSAQDKSKSQQMNGYGYSNISKDINKSKKYNHDDYDDEVNLDNDSDRNNNNNNNNYLDDNREGATRKNNSSK